MTSSAAATQANTPALDPERMACSIAQSRLLPLAIALPRASLGNCSLHCSTAGIPARVPSDVGWIISKRSMLTPCCCKAGAYGTNGGAIHATHFLGLAGSSFVNAPSAGINNPSSPIP